MVYPGGHFASRGDVILRGGFSDSDHTAFVGGDSTFEIYSGWKSHNNFARGGSAGLLIFCGTNGVAEGLLIEDNFVSGEPTTYGHGHGGGGLWVADGSSLFLRNSALRRNSVSFSLPYPLLASSAVTPLLTRPLTCRHRH